ncbi:UNKNOWN [Stylonychia lemnae]|uniref:Uncharacterized protein n=1 Tax=Stylonychia lemnae TaxID=5949 RepID=A0A078A4Y3_STYLE|nr:UNKNOWN [Stylonychia lemnae]|eukprot:CDW76630.1 UNKNOWN [Stylonychia lemnae]
MSSYQPENDLFQRLLFTQNNDTFNNFNKRGLVDREETELLEFEIEQHYQFLEKQHHPIMKNSNQLSKSKTRAKEEINEPSMDNENLLRYLNKEDKSQKKQKGAKRQFKAEQMLLESPLMDEQQMLNDRINSLKKNLKLSGIPLFGNLVNPSNVINSANQTLTCIQSLISQMNQIKQECQKSSDVQNRLQNENTALYAKNEGLQDIIKELKEKLKGVRLDVKNITEKKIDQGEQIKQQDRMKQQDIQKMEMKMTQMSHELKKIQVQKFQLQEKIQKMLDMNRYNLGIVELNGRIIKNKDHSPVRKRQANAEDLNKELLMQNTLGYEKQIKVFHTEHEKLMECLDLFECTLNTITPNLGFMDVYDTQNVQEYLDKFKEEIQKVFINRSSSLNSHRSSPLKSSPLKQSSKNLTPIKQQLSESKQTPIEEKDEEQERIDYEKLKWKALFSLNKETGNTIIFD